MSQNKIKIGKQSSKKLGSKLITGSTVSRIMTTYHTPTHMPARDYHTRQEVLLIYAVSYAITYEPPIGVCTAYLHRRATAVAAPCAKKGTLTNLREQQASLRQKISVLYANKAIGAQGDQEGEQNDPKCGRRHDRCTQYIPDIGRYPYPSKTRSLVSLRSRGEKSTFGYIFILL